MKFILLIMKNTINVLPYFMLIGIYFFFIGLEEKKERKIDSTLKKEYNIQNNIVNAEKKIMRINIPVIPYKEKISN